MQFDEFLKKEEENAVVKTDSGLENFKTLAEKDTKDVVNAMVGASVMELAKTDEDTKNKIQQVAKKKIDNKIVIEDEKDKGDIDKAKFENNKEACKIYGVADSVPQWQQRLMRIGANLWFVVYFLIATLTIAPISTFIQKVTTVLGLKNKVWVAILLGVLMYALIVIVIPLLIGLL